MDVPHTKQVQDCALFDREAQEEAMTQDTLVETFANNQVPKMKRAVLKYLDAITDKMRMMRLS